MLTGINPSRALMPVALVTFALMGAGCAGTESPRGATTDQTPATATEERDCSKDPEALQETCEAIVDQLEEDWDDSISTTNVGGPCTAAPLNEEIAARLAGTMAAYEGIGAPEYHYSHKIRDDGRSVEFRNVYMETDLGVRVSYLPRELMAYDITTFDKFASLQAEVDRPAEEIESGEYGWAAIQHVPEETATYYQLADDGQTHLRVEFNGGPLDLSATQTTATDIRDIICAGP